MTKPYAKEGWYAGGLRKAGKKHDRVIPESDPVDRDPCQRCGVRHDIGCNHSQVPLGMML